MGGNIDVSALLVSGGGTSRRDVTPALACKLTLGGVIQGTIVRRGEKVPHGEAGTPIIVCTRNDDLASVVQVHRDGLHKVFHSEEVQEMGHRSPQTFFESEGEVSRLARKRQ
eukprot:1151362-Pelagomonas_calceolata.AAC.7